MYTLVITSPEVALEVRFPDSRALLVLAARVTQELSPPLAFEFHGEVEQLLDTFPSGWIHRIFQAIFQIEKKQLSTIAARSGFINASVSRAINSSSATIIGFLRKADKNETATT